MIHSLNYYDKPNFTSRAAEIRKADDLCRYLKKVYPVQMPSKFNQKSLYLHSSPLMRLDKKLKLLRNNLDITSSNEDFFKLLIKEVKMQNVANCGEMGRLSDAVFKLNGYKDCFLVDIFQHIPDVCDNYDVDHCALAVKGKKELIIVDPWCGFCDYASNAIVKYKTLFSNLLKFGAEPTESKLVFKQDGILSFPIENIEKFKKAFPELVIERAKKHSNKRL